MTNSQLSFLSHPSPGSTGRPASCSPCFRQPQHTCCFCFSCSPQDSTTLFLCSSDSTCKERQHCSQRLSYHQQNPGLPGTPQPVLCTVPNAQRSQTQADVTHQFRDTVVILKPAAGAACQQSGKQVSTNIFTSQALKICFHYQISESLRNICFGVIPYSWAFLLLHPLLVRSWCSDCCDSGWITTADIWWRSS